MSLEMTLPRQRGVVKRSNASSIDEVPKEENENSLMVKVRPVRRYSSKLLLLVCMSCNAGGISLMTYYTRHRTNGPMYISSTVVYYHEVLKMIISFGMLWYETRSLYVFSRRIFDEIICRPVEVLKICVPALLYALQNNLMFFALSHIDAPTYQVTSQLKILTTSLLMHVVLKKRLSVLQWFSMILLCLSVVIVNFQPEVLSHTKGDYTMDYVIGLLAVLISCLCSSLAGVYFEKMLKNSESSFWIRNIEMYFWGILTTRIGIMLQNNHEVSTYGLTYGWTTCVYVLVAMQSVGGVFASLIIKHMDNNVKSFGAAGGILIATFGSFIFFGKDIYLQFFCGTILVMIAMFLYFTK